MGCQHCGEDPCEMYDEGDTMTLPGSAIDAGLLNDEEGPGWR